MLDAKTITMKCRTGTPHRDYFCLCKTLAPLRPYGAEGNPETTSTDPCGCIRLIVNPVQVAVVDPACDRHGAASS
ncbi:MULTISPECIES: hypothetical protein [Citricoccus]|uniref:hypothetical protein n=1 Tax=Citricoccus TaxID=169133 RepID=UPI000255F1C4|nr:hypothetical protein [Citricoccus sp. CH26A]